MDRKRPINSQKGNMPFTVIAVVLLIVGSAYGVMLSYSEESEDNAENIVTELGSLDAAIHDTAVSVERNLGEIIYRISTDPEGGSLNKRAESFEKLSGEWMSSAYPSVNKGVTVSVSDFDFTLIAESLKLSGSDSFMEGFVPSYLKATGHYTAKFMSGSGTSVRTVEVSTDGTCALPLVAEQGSLFEVMTSGNGSALSQMMSHQLTSLAQYRVLNGYGALAEYGNMGTRSVLTDADVKSAYKSSVSMIELLVFHCPSDGISADLKKIDLADHLISNNGYIELDLSAIYSQALISIADDLVLQWFDYLYGNILIEQSDRISDTLKNAWDSLRGFLKGTNEFSAAPYIEGVMRENGFDVDHYQYLFSEDAVVIKIPAADIGSNGKTMVVPAFEFTVDYPSVDLMSWGGISNFKSDYRNDTNELGEWFRDVINSAAVRIGASKALGTVRIPIDPSDNEGFMTALRNGVSDALSGADSKIEKIMTSAISEQNISDPFYSAIYNVISRDLEDIYGTDLFLENVNASLRSSIAMLAENGKIDTKYDLNAIADRVMDGDAVLEEMSAYKNAVYDCGNDLSVLNNVPGGQPGIIKELCISLFKNGFFFNNTLTDIPGRILMLCDEAIENTNINGYSGILDLPATNGFTLINGSGNVSTEKLSFSSKSSPSVSVGGPNDNLSDCIHYVGFNDKSGASYATSFSVKIKDRMEYTVRSSGVVETAMGTSDSVFKGTSDIDIEFKVTVASGWGLAGVKQYTPSNNLLGDAWNALIELLSPLLEPLRKVLSLITDALSILNSALMEFSKYVAAVVEKLYNAIMIPLEKIGAFIDENLNKLFDKTMEAAIGAVEWIVGADLSKQTVGFSFMGFTLTFTAKLSTLVSNTKTLLTVTMSYVLDKLTISGSVTIKQKGSGSDKEMMLSGKAGVIGEDWEVHAEIDPKMRSTSHLLSMTGHVRGVQFDIVFPDMVQYKELEFSLSDIPALGAVLSNIPLPIPGMKGSIDAGINLKFNIPFETGILINEFELNPPGEDKDKEWAEIYNATKSTVDLNGYTLHAGSNPKTKVYTISGLTLSPGQKEVIMLPGSFLNNSGSSLLSAGESLTLNDPNGNKVDSTPAKKDSKNDSFTWQRVADGAIDWTFAEGTPGTGNCGGMVSGEMVKTQVLKILKESAVETMEKMKKLTDTDDLSEFFKTAMHRAVTTGIEMFASCLVEASIFVSLDITDATSTVCSGVRIALFIDSGFVEEGLKYLVGEIESILLNIENPYGLKPKDVFTDNLYLGVTVYFGMDSPQFLKNADQYPRIKLGVHVNSNISGLCRLAGSDAGKWKVTAGVLIMDCPYAVLPSALKADKTLETDLWLLRATFISK